MVFEDAESAISVVVMLAMSVAFLVKRQSFARHIVEYWGKPEADIPRTIRVIQVIGILGIVLAAWSASSMVVRLFS